MTSMKTVQFLHHLLPFFICLNGSELRKTSPPSAPGRRNVGTSYPLPTSIPFGILAAYRLYLVDVSITYHARATHNFLQLKINLN